MNRSRRLRMLALPLVLAAALAGCNKSQPAPNGRQEGHSAVAPDAKPGLALTGGKLVLPTVKGNPGAAYFTLANSGAKPATIAAVDVAGAGMAMLHQTLQTDGHSTMEDMSAPQIKPGETLVFAPGGNHVMVDAVPDSWKPGGTTEITLTFADGDKLSAPLAIEAPGGD
ncbi:MAG TPA: copper chaperone PCu(A)C [Novosphingobium sp.]